MRKTGLNTISELALKNKDVVFIGSDLGPDVLSDLKEQAPEQFFMEGISEGHVLGMAAGMALSGNIVYVNTIASFIVKRAFEQLALDICYENLNVRLYGNGGGLVYGPLGHTHTCVDDFSILETLPNLTILAPADANEMNQLIKKTESHQGPVYIRLGKGGDPVVTKGHDIEIGKALYYPSESLGRTLIITTGIMLQRCLDIQNDNNSISVLHFATVQPFASDELVNYLDKYENIVVIEEHLEKGGLGSRVKSTLFDNGINKNFHHFHLGEGYPSIYGRQEEIFAQLGLTPERMGTIIKERFDV